ncbi:MAG: HAMP domain-containing protein [Candidatus Rokubacteria bacterium]|nr:HAMP domain-containing protein [Candidatus Rokubacteria bacterium]
MPPGIKWSSRLSVKLPAVIAVIIVVVLGSLVIVAVRVQRRHLTTEVVRSAALFSDTIKSSTYHFMLEDRRDEVYRIIETIGGQSGVERVRIFNKDGQITFSTDRSEIGGLVDKRAESCYACHATDQPIARLALTSRSRIYRHNGDRILGMVTPIYNEPSCTNASCHFHLPGQRVLGVVDIGLSLGEIDRGMLALERRMLALSSAVVAGLVAIVAVAARRVVVRPVSQLLAATERVADGDLEQRMTVRSADEIGALAASFNHMTESLRRARSEIRELMDGLERQVEERTAALRSAQNQLVQSEKLASLGKLAASIAHEINNPLSGILTSSKLLLRTVDEGRLPDDAAPLFARHLGLMERETHRCTAIVRNLLDFARQREPTFGQVDVNVCIDEALSLLRNQIAIQRIALDKRLQELPVVTADFGQLRQAFVNVIMNACEAMGEGGTLTITSRGVDQGAAVAVEVADTGTGIAPEDLSKILDPFFTTKEKGTGLGLSVVYGIVVRHGGRLDFRSEPGRGTAVLIRLPVAGPTESAA